MTLVKICGICNLADAEKALELGASLLGFIFAESPRKIDPADIRPIRKRLEGKVKFVGVFKDQDSRYVNDMADLCKLDFVQLHGAETADYCHEIAHPVIKAIELYPEQNFPNLSSYLLHAFLFDRPKQLSKQEDWLDLVIEKHREQLSERQPFFIAGGLNASNVKKVLRLNPYGIDVASGVESEPRNKDHEKLEQFFQAVQGAKTC